ncbi:hypothetical protein [Halosimplex amylolyticum]|uniref:hypothetical protein n=1 Tax=Halosimplex amylolyticum TaxID=3396616 RepID=UPI003F56139D
MIFENISDSDVAQSTTVVLALLGLFLIGVIAVSVLFLGGLFDDSTPSKTAETALSTETNSISTVPTSTQNADSTPTESSTIIPITTQTQAPPSTATYTPTATIDPTPTPGPYANERYGEFVDVVFGETETYSGVPVKIRGWRVVEGEILIIAVNLSARSEDENRRVKQVNALVTAGYTQAVVQYDNGKIEGKIPNRLRIAEVNNTGSKPKMWYLNTSLAREYYLNKITTPEFTDQYWETVENQTEAQEAYINRLDQAAGNVTLSDGKTK